VPIVPSRAGRIQELLARLASRNGAERDSAVAGLRLLGSRVIEPLRSFLADAGASARLAALEILETLDDRRVLPLVLDLASAGDDTVAARALEVAAGRPDPRAVPPLAALMADTGSVRRRHAAALALVRLQAAGAVEALDPLVAGVLDEAAEPWLRLVVLDALAALDPPLAPRTLRPLLERLAASTVPAVAARAAALRRAALEGATRPEPIGRLAAVLGKGGALSIPVLLDALEGLGDARAARADPAAAETRAAIHRALAALDSRAALFDLREAIESRPSAGMASLLEAAGRVGDARILPALARAAAEEPALFEPCAVAFSAIVRRGSLRRPGARPKGVRPEQRATFDALWERAKGARRAPRR
jgi:HEAT repeat protein